MNISGWTQVERNFLLGSLTLCNMHVRLLPFKFIQKVITCECSVSGKTAYDDDMLYLYFIIFGVDCKEREQYY